MLVNDVAVDVKRKSPAENRGQRGREWEGRLASEDVDLTHTPPDVESVGALPAGAHPNRPAGALGYHCLPEVHPGGAVRGAVVFPASAAFAHPGGAPLSLRPAPVVSLSSFWSHNG